MSFLVPITLLGWPFVAIALFTVLPPRRAVLAAYMLAWLFLPQAGIDVPGFPDIDKINATSLGALAGVLLFDAQRLSRFSFSWVDIPVIVWCLTSMLSALTNELPPDATSPLYDGISGLVKDSLTWGVPYLIGRLYFNNLVALRELAIGIFLGGLIYAPLCLFEMKMSPCLHQFVYGYHPSSFLMTLRYGGYRPMVFMQHGLMLSMWMTCTALVGAWLWKTGSLRRIFNLPMGPIVLVLIVVTVLCKSTGAIALLVLGLGVLYLNSIVRSNALLIAIAIITPIYMTVRIQGIWSGKQLVDLAYKIDSERGDSLAGRLENEDMLNQHAAKKSLFGWGGWGRWRVHDPKTGEDITVSDGMWVIARGERGLVGLASVTALVLLPYGLLLARVRARYWTHPWLAAPAALAVILMLYSIDNLFNAMLNPVYLLAAGGLSGFYLAFPQVVARERHARAVQRLAHVAQHAPQGPRPLVSVD